MTLLLNPEDKCKVPGYRRSSPGRYYPQGEERDPPHLPPALVPAAGCSEAVADVRGSPVSTRCSSLISLPQITLRIKTVDQKITGFIRKRKRIGTLVFHEDFRCLLVR